MLVNSAAARLATPASRKWRRVSSKCSSRKSERFMARLAARDHGGERLLGPRRKARRLGEGVVPDIFHDFASLFQNTEVPDRRAAGVENVAPKWRVFECEVFELLRFEPLIDPQPLEPELVVKSPTPLFGRHHHPSLEIG